MGPPWVWDDMHVPAQLKSRVLSDCMVNTEPLNPLLTAL
jgi:hypothetical protein